MQLNCIQCVAAYEVRDWTQKHTHFCEACRAKRARSQKRAVYAEVVRTIESALAAGEVSDEELTSFEESREDAWDEDTLVRLAQDSQVVPDRQPVGWLSPAGSDDGRSSYFREVRDELDALSATAALHSWWAENPHWCAPLHVDLSPVALEPAACGDAKGTVAGRWRHVRAKEDPCELCRDAWRADTREKMRSVRAR